MRKAIAVVLWLAAAALFVRAYTAPQVPLRVEALPQIGERLALNEIANTFQITPLEDVEEYWILVLTSSCPWCLALDSELTTLVQEASCHNAELLPVVIELDMPTDSVRAVLAKHNLEIAGTAGPDALSTLRVHVVPTLIALTQDGEVLRVLSKRRQNWPPRPVCSRI